MELSIGRITGCAVNGWWSTTGVDPPGIPLAKSDLYPSRRWRGTENSSLLAVRIE